MSSEANFTVQACTQPAHVLPAVRKHLVLLGAGHAHVHVLQGLAGPASVGLKITVVTPHLRQLYSGMVPGFVAGHYRLDECVIPLGKLLIQCGARLIQSSAAKLDANAQTVTLVNGDTLSYDYLSLNTGPVMDRHRIESQMPGAREHALFVRPIESFARLWPRVLDRAKRQKIHLAVVGAGAAGLELAMAAAYALRGSGCAAGSRVTLVTGGQAPGAAYPVVTRHRIAKALEHLRVEVLLDACIDMSSGQIGLASGAKLACDLPILAVGAQAPAWLASSGLALDAQGFAQVNAFQQSTSHAAVFAAGDVASRVDAPHAKSGVYAVRAGPPLLANLLSALNSQALAAYQPQGRTLYLLSCGGKQAIAAWGGFSMQGAWVWRWKNRIDRRFVATYGA